MTKPNSERVALRSTLVIRARLSPAQSSRLLAIDSSGERITSKLAPAGDYALLLLLRWRSASNRQTPVATETVRLLTLPAIGSLTR